jgi:hypothetical protein
VSNPSVLAYVQQLKPRLGGVPAEAVAALESAAKAIDDGAGASPQQWNDLVVER